MPTLAFFLLLAIAYFYSSFFRTYPLTRWLTALPVVYLVSDYLENIGIVTMLLGFPASLPSMARLANFMFMVKNISSNAAILVVVIGLVLRAMRLTRKAEPQQRIA